MVGQAAVFHDDQVNGLVGEPALELGACQALGFNDAPVLVGDSDLENGFGQVDDHGSRMHLGLFSFVEDLIPSPMKTRVRISRKQTGESIPSIERTRNGKAPWPCNAFVYDAPHGQIRRTRHQEGLKP
jgi:hypothetical protein